MAKAGPERLATAPVSHPRRAVENLDIARILEEVADLPDIQGGNPFRVRAYRTATREADLRHARHHDTGGSRAGRENRETDMSTSALIAQVSTFSVSRVLVPPLLCCVVMERSDRDAPVAQADRAGSSSRRIAAAFVALLLSVAVGAATEQRSTSPRLREGLLPAQIPRGVGGGEVVLELTVDSRGSVRQIERVRMTPPYADVVVNSAAQWRFEPATTVIDGRATSVAGSLLVVAVFRPAWFYAGLAPGVPPQVVGALSPRVPSVESVVLPAYPPTAIGDAIVLIEIEMSSHAEPRGYRIVGPASGFDTAALEAVRSWRFGAPQAPDIADPVFAYAVVGFRAPLATKP